MRVSPGLVGFGPRIGLERHECLAKGHIHRSLGQRPRNPLVKHCRLKACFNHPHRRTGEVDFQPTPDDSNQPMAFDAVRTFPKRFVEKQDPDHRHLQDQRRKYAWDLWSDSRTPSGRNPEGIATPWLKRLSENSGLA